MILVIHLRVLEINPIPRPMVVTMETEEIMGDGGGATITVETEGVEIRKEPITSFLKLNRNEFNKAGI
jgi:hypothetical protein